MAIQAKRMWTLLLSSSSEELRKESVITQASIGPLLNKPVKEQRALASAYEQKGTPCDLFIAAFILGDLGSRAGASTHGAWQAQKSLELFKLAAEKGSPSAWFQLGGYYLDRKRPREAVEPYRKAAELGHPSAMHKLALLYDGEGAAGGVKRDVKQAAAYYAMAAESGHAGAMHNLAELVEEGEATCPEGWTLARLRSTAAARGDSNGKVALAKTHFPLDGAEEALRGPLLRYLFDAFTERPTDENAAFLLGCHYMPRGGEGGQESSNPSADRGKALFFLKRVKAGPMAGTAQGWAAGLDRQQQQQKVRQKQKQKGRAAQQRHQERGSGSSPLVEDTEPLLKELLTEAVQRVSASVDEAYDAALRTALEEFRLLVAPAQAADETTADANANAAAAAAATTTAADATATTTAAAATDSSASSVVAAPAASFLSASPGGVGAALLFCAREGCDSTTNLQRCARCRVVAYCSRDCQQAAWKTHKKVCVKIGK